METPDKIANVILSINNEIDNKQDEIDGLEIDILKLQNEVEGLKTALRLISDKLL